MMVWCGAIARRRWRAAITFLFADAKVPLLLCPAAAAAHMASRRGSELPSAPAVEATRWEALHSRWHGACATARCLCHEPATRGDAAAAAWLRRCYHAPPQGGARIAACDTCCLAPQCVGVVMVSAWCHCHRALQRDGVCEGRADAVAVSPRCRCCNRAALCDDDGAF